MTYHSHSSWTFDDEPTDAVVKEVIAGLKYNKRYNKGEYYTPAAYATFCAVDSLIYHLGMFLDTFDKREVTEGDVKKFLGEASESGRVIVRKALKELKVFGE